MTPTPDKPDHVEALREAHSILQQFVDSRNSMYGSGITWMPSLYKAYDRAVVALSPKAVEPVAGEAGSTDTVLRKALAEACAFSAYQTGDPLAIRFEFGSDSDRLAAANAVDAALASGEG